MLAAVDFQGGPGTAELMEAVAILKELNASRRPEGPRRGARLGSCPTRYAGYLEKARKAGETPRLPALLGAVRDPGAAGRAALGDVYVPGSRRYADPATYLLHARRSGSPSGASTAGWSASRRGRRRAGAGQGGAARGAGRAGEHPGGALPDDTGTVRLDDDEDLVIPPLTAEDVPAEARALKEELTGMLPFAPIASLLIELDARTGFLDCFTHAGGQADPHRRNSSATSSRC